ncbi:ankyrin-3-like [Mytilus trossulus]|uniref:ankyrin-3-like n=1 Tax=Mytilus trossulus TaxID=6551 RepID=UPI003004DA95
MNFESFKKKILEYIKHIPEFYRKVFKCWVISGGGQTNKPTNFTEVSKQTIPELGFTPLIIAVHARNLQIVQYLITVGCQRDARDNMNFESFKKKILEYIKHIPEFYRKVFKCWVTSGGGQTNKPTNFTEVSKQDDFTPLLLAVQEGYPDIVRFLIKANCDREARTKLGLTPLLVAAYTGHLTILQYLLAVGCVKETRSYNGETVLHHAAWGGHLQVTKWLIEDGGISPLVVTHQNETPYDLAAIEYNDDDTQRKQEKKEVMDFLKAIVGQSHIAQITIN